MGYIETYPIMLGMTPPNKFNNNMGYIETNIKKAKINRIDMFNNNMGYIETFYFAFFCIEKGCV